MAASDSGDRARPSPIPEGTALAIPHLVVRGGSDAIEFYKRAFGAVETMRIPAPEGLVGHAEMRVGEAVFMLADEFPSMGIVGPATLGGTSVTIHLYVQDVDATASAAVRAGAKLIRPVADQFYGERVAVIEDPFGHRWSLSSRIEELSADEVVRRGTRLSQT